MPATLILASASRYKRALLERLQLAFHCMDPAVDEAPRSGEQAPALAARLARAKALAISAQRPEALVIGADQVAALGSTVLGKPGSADRARQQLRDSSGRHLMFHTAVALARGEHLLGERCIATSVSFRELTEAQIANYVRHEQPLDCAGSFRWEGLGIALFRALRSEDPTALEGLPLIALTDLLREAGINPLGGAE